MFSSNDIRSGLRRLQQQINELSTKSRKTHDSIKQLDREIQDMRQKRLTRAIEHSINPRTFLLRERRLHKALKEVDQLKHDERKYTRDIQRKKQDYQSLYNLQREVEHGNTHALGQAQSLMTHI